jgi:prepilin-type N-terminal cleavage/methylation domain-containing protein/prepilin-type processing-associated H-X9-DG protein
MKTCGYFHGASMPISSNDPVRTSIRPAAFTLIELLVVVSVIAILAGMLLPAIGIVKSTADSTSCMNNMRQLGLGIAGYGVDWTGFIPPRATTFWASETSPWNGAWPGRLLSYTDSDSRTSKVWTCPRGNWRRGDATPSGGTISEQQLAHSSYSSNGVILHPTSGGNPPGIIAPIDDRWVYEVSIHRFTKPTNTILAVEIWAVIGVGGGWMGPAGNPSIADYLDPWNHAYRTPSSSRIPTSSPWACFALRVSHRSKSNYVFGDGRVEALSPQQTGTFIPSGESFRLSVAAPPTLWSARL